MAKKKICVVIINRANYGRLKPLLKKIQNHPDLELQLIVGSSMLIYRFGQGINIMERDGFKIDAKLYMHVDGESNLTMAKSVGVGLMEIVSVFERLQPDLVITHADRYETIATAVAASYMNIPLAHTLGGEITGTIDEHVRHAVTKLSHIHFAAHEFAAKRIVQMGEDSKNVHVVGNPSLDIIKEMDKTISNDFWLKYGGKYGGTGGPIDLTKPYLLCMQHPVTTEVGKGREQIRMILDAVKSVDLPVIWFWPNNDAESNEIAKPMREEREKGLLPKIHFFRSLEVEDYLKLLNGAACIVGNSSSGIMEAGFMGVPAVNIGSRQAGRERCRNVFDVDYNLEEIKNAIKTQINHGRYEPDYMFGDGNASARIVGILEKFDSIRIQKQFITL
jgi:UDP-hydrolysing UDP-N-acetyl-D-glucosamine 2-epimerase